MYEEKKRLKQELPDESPDGDTEEAEMVQQQSDQTQQILETGTVTPTKGKYTIHCLTIVGQVEGHYILPPQNKTTKYEHVIPQLVAIQENPEIEGLIIILNTVGGDVEAGLAIAELVSGLKKPTVSLVLGGGHSIGVPLAVSAKKSFIVPSATMTIHPVRMNGVVLGVPQTLSYFDKMQERIVTFVEQNSDISPKKFRQLMMNMGELVMDVGTVLNGKQAVEYGLIDYLGGLSDAIQCLYDLIEEERKAKQREEDEIDGDKRDCTAHVRANNVQKNRADQKSQSRRKTTVKQRRHAVASVGADSGSDASDDGEEQVRTYIPASMRSSTADERVHNGPVSGKYHPDSNFTNGTARGRERQNHPPMADGIKWHNKAGAEYSESALKSPKDSHYESGGDPDNAHSFGNAGNNAD